jgi:hypothetical protein
MLDELLEVYGDMLVDELEEEIYEDGGYDIENYYPSQGSVSGLTYYDDTEPIGKELMDEFLEATQQHGYTCGEVNEMAQGNINNFVAWFMWEYLLNTYREEVIEYVKENSDMFNSEEDGE